MKNSMISTGNCGEYFVAAELERRGFTVAVPMSNVENFDILAINRTTFHQIAIQVKTNKDNNKEWILKDKAEKLVEDNIYYIFVVLNGLDNPEYHIVSSKTVADYVYSNYRQWLDTPGRNGAKHKDTTIRKFSDKNDTYLNNWDILN